MFCVLFTLAPTLPSVVLHVLCPVHSNSNSHLCISLCFVSCSLYLQLSPPSFSMFCVLVTLPPTLTSVSLHVLCPVHSTSNSPPSLFIFCALFTLPPSLFLFCVLVTLPPTLVSLHVLCPVHCTSHSHLCLSLCFVSCSL
jgi:hypothetical protein